MNAVLKDQASNYGHATIVGATLDQLAVSALNVRSRPGPLAELKAQLQAFDLLQNLVGLWSERPGVLIDIVAGQRRLLAIGELVAEGLWPADFIIPVLIVAPHETVAISLAENVGRVPMHPADVFDAMRALAGQGASAREIGISFGLAAATVQQQLKLARVAAPLLALYRAGQASLEQMQALAVSDDEQAQQQAWDSLPPHGREPYALRRLLTATCLHAQRDRVVRFLGLAAIRKAGGTVREDMFSSSGDQYVDDAALVERLAQHRLARLADKVRAEGHAWVEVALRTDHAALAAYGRAPLVRTKADAMQAAALERIECALAAQQDKPQDVAALRGWQRRRRALIEAREGIVQALLVPEPDCRQQCGALVTLDAQGKPVVHRHLLRPAHERGRTRGAPQRQRGVHSERLLRQLTAHRTAALGAALLQQPQCALALLVDALLRAHGHRVPEDPVLTLRADPKIYAAAVWESAAGQQLAAARDALPAQLAALPEGDSRIARLAALSPECLLQLLAALLALSLDMEQGSETAHGGYLALASVLPCDARDWWQPTVDNYLGQVSKARLLEVVGEALGRTAAVPLERLPRAQAAQQGERLLAGQGWLPPVLRAAGECSAPADKPPPTELTA